MASDIFVDKLVDITVTGGVVRLDFANLSPFERESGTPTFTLSQRLIVPIDSFVQMTDTISKMISLMIEKGTLINKAEDVTPGS